MICVLDASAMIALVKNEPGADIVQAILIAPGNHCVAHPVNLCEVYSPMARDAGEERAERFIQGLFDIGVTPRRDIDLPFCWEVARLRARFKAEGLRVSLADCFGIATARRLDGEFLTGDHAELDPVVPMGVCKVRFFR